MIYPQEKISVEKPVKPVRRRDQAVLRVIALIIVFVSVFAFFVKILFF
jgi:hypothetical protein